MSEAEQPAADSALSFDRAEFEEAATPELTCAFCQKPLTGQYWQISRRPACAQCLATVQREVASSLSMSRFFGALRWGALAAVAGSIGWVVITKVTGYEIGFVAIGIGYIVGKAVRKGARGFGGTRYQVLAILLTYSAIAFASLPALFDAVSHPHHSEAAQATQHAVSIPSFLWACLVLLAIAFASPFLQGTENFMGWIIIGIGLYEAWKFTRAIPIQILGPFSLAAKMPVVPVAIGPHAAD